MTVSVGTDSPDLMGADEFMAKIGMGRSGFYQLCREDRLPIPALKIGRRYYFSRKAWERKLTETRAESGNRDVMDTDRS